MSKSVRRSVVFGISFFTLLFVLAIIAYPLNSEKSRDEAVLISEQKTVSYSFRSDTDKENLIAETTQSPYAEFIQGFEGTFSSKKKDIPFVLFAVKQTLPNGDTDHWYISLGGDIFLLQSSAFDYYPQKDTLSPAVRRKWFLLQHEETNVAELVLNYHENGDLHLQNSKLALIPKIYADGVQTIIEIADQTDKSRLKEETSSYEEVKFREANARRADVCFDISQSEFPDTDRCSILRADDLQDMKYSQVPPEISEYINRISERLELKLKLHAYPQDDVNVNGPQPTPIGPPVTLDKLPEINYPEADKKISTNVGEQ